MPQPPLLVRRGILQAPSLTTQSPHRPALKAIRLDVGARYYRGGLASYLQAGGIQDNPDGSISSARVSYVEINRSSFCCAFGGCYERTCRMKRLSDDLDDTVHIALCQRGVHRKLQCMFGSFGNGAAGFKFLEQVEHVADVDMHYFDVKT
jgi:hypothetical protein